MTGESNTKTSGQAFNQTAGQPTGIMPRREFGWTAGSCSVCTLPEDELLALNLLLSDPKLWPRETFKGLKLPKGALPAGYRLWGAVKVARAWCEEHGIVINNKAMRKHYNNHVVQVPASAYQFAETGMLSEQDSRFAKPIMAISPVNFREYYAKGVDLGNRALDMLIERITRMQEEGKEVPLDLILKASELGLKLSMSAAQLTQRGMELERAREDELAGFRAGSQPLPSPRMGHSRIRVIDGEARPVVDEGRADRREYNERTADNGGARLPA